MHLNSFLQYIQFEKRYSENTVKAYRKDLNQFFTYLNTDDFTTVTHFQVRDWLVDLVVEQEMTTRTVNRKFSTVKSFVRFLQRKQVIQHNPLSKVSPPKWGKSLPTFIQEKAMADYFSSKKMPDSFEDLRDLLILELLYSTGMRRGELIGLQLGDFDKDRMTLKVLGKGAKERFVPVSAQLKLVLEPYIEKRNAKFGQDGALVVTNKGAMMYPKFVYGVVKTALSQVTSIEKKSPHILRHTFATLMLNNGADLNAIKEILGHSSLAATQVYAHNSFEKLKQVYQQAHPRA